MRHVYGTAMATPRKERYGTVYLLPRRTAWDGEQVVVAMAVMLLVAGMVKVVVMVAVLG